MRTFSRKSSAEARSWNMQMRCADLIPLSSSAAVNKRLIVFDM